MARSLHQVIAVVKPTKSRAENALTKLYHLAQKGGLNPGPFNGVSKTYEPLDDAEGIPPNEGTVVQEKAADLLVQAGSILTPVLDLVATQDAGNTRAMADLVVDGETLLSNVPATFYLYLEKRLVDLRTFIASLPVLDPTEEWEDDVTTGVFRSKDKVTNRGKKVPFPFVLVAATEKHPAQVNVEYEDKIVGNWRTVKFSGALTRARSNELLARVEKLQDAVKLAREEANKVDVEDVAVGLALFNYVLS